MIFCIAYLNLLDEYVNDGKNGGVEYAKYGKNGGKNGKNGKNGGKNGKNGGKNGKNGGKNGKNGGKNGKNGGKKGGVVIVPDGSDVGEFPIAFVA